MRPQNSLLFAIGLKGGVGIAASVLQLQVAIRLAADTVPALVVPLYAFFIAAAIAVRCGSTSAVKFIAAAVCEAATI